MSNREDTGSEWLIRLAHELEGPRLATLVDTMDDAVRANVASYAELPKTAGFRQGLQRTAVVYCRTLAERRRINDRERVGLHVIGSQRARHGLAPDDVTGAVDVAIAAGWSKSLDILRELGADIETVTSFAAGALPWTLAFAGDVRAALLRGCRESFPSAITGPLVG